MLPELDEDYSVELLTNRRLSHYNGRDRVLMPIYESVITSPFSKVAIYSLLEIFKAKGWSVEKSTGKVNTDKEYIVGKYPGTGIDTKCGTNDTLFWLTVEFQNNTPDRISSWLICPDKTPLTITLTIAKVVGDTQKYYTGLVYWDPTNPIPLTDIVKRHILKQLTPSIV